MIFPLSAVKTLAGPLNLGWDFQKQHVKRILAGERKVQFTNGRESKVLEHLDVKAQALKTMKDRVTPSALRLPRPVLLPPRLDTLVLVPTRTSRQCLATGPKEFLDEYRLHMAHCYHRKVERHTPFAVMVGTLSRKPVTLAKVTQVGTAEPYRGSFYTMDMEDLLHLQKELKPEPKPGQTVKPEADGSPPEPRPTQGP